MPFQISTSIKRLKSLGLSKIYDYSVPSEVYTGCTTSIELTAVVNENLTGHTVEWEQTSGSSVLWLTPVNQLVVMFTPSLNDDKIFRFWIDKGLPSATYKDVYVYASPVDSLTHSAAMYEAQPDNMYGLPNLLKVTEHLHVPSSPSGEITYNESTYDVYLDEFVGYYITPNSYYYRGGVLTLRYQSPIDEAIVNTLQIQHNNAGSYTDVSTSSHPPMVVQGVSDPEYFRLKANYTNLTSVYSHSIPYVYPVFDHSSSYSKSTVGDSFPAFSVGQKSATVNVFTYEWQVLTFIPTEQMPQMYMYNAPLNVVVVPQPEYTLYSYTPTEDMVSLNINTPIQSSLTLTLYNGVVIGGGT